MNLNNSAWEKLFSKYQILDALNKYGSFEISANQIKEFREPRLMTKFDHEINLPEIFSRNHLSILPITRGDYSISTYSAYQELTEHEHEIERFRPPGNLQSLIPEYISSETMALNYAYASGILNDFLDDDNLFPTVNGRMSSGSFDFVIKSRNGLQKINVNNSQLEIDGAYEGFNNVSLIEVKLDISKDFIIRQLFYPFKLWEKRLTKPLKSVFLIYTNGRFMFYEFQFSDPNSYNSLVMLKRKDYIIATGITVMDIESLLDQISIDSEPALPFPQADSMERIVNLIELLYEKEMTKDDITTEYEFDKRQTKYYTDAGRYLELIGQRKDTNGNTKFQLTALARNILGFSQKERQLKLASQITKHKVFKDVLSEHLKYGVMPSKDRIVNLMKNSNLYHIESEATYLRRASTIISWVNWILNLIDE